MNAATRIANERNVRLRAMILGLTVFLAVGLLLIPDRTLAQAGPVVATPAVDPARGRILFVRKACVVCHSVNGIGGTMGPPLDAAPGPWEIDVSDFAARMWRGAGQMVWLQTLELGYQIDLTGEDIAHLAGFTNDSGEQAKFEENQVPGRILDSLLTEPYQRPDDWIWNPATD